MYRDKIGGINMTSAIKIDIKKKGFPVTIGEIELWIDTSIESMQRLANAESEIERRLEKLRVEAKDVNVSEDVENVNVEMVNKAIELYKKTVKVQYDVVFGEGTFDKIYKKYPDLSALERVIDDVMPAIAKEIEKIEW